MNIKYECGFCGRGFECEEACKAHESSCSFIGVKVRRISINSECWVDSYRYVFHVDDMTLTRGGSEYFEEDAVNSDECEDAGYEYVVYTTDLSKEHERELRIKLLNQAIMELPGVVANYTQLLQSAEKLKEELD